MPMNIEQAPKKIKSDAFILCGFDFLRQRLDVDQFFRCFDISKQVERLASFSLFYFGRNIMICSKLPSDLELLVLIYDPR